MTDTFLVTEVSPTKTVEYRVPIALKEVFDDWAAAYRHVVIVQRFGPRMTVARFIEALRPMFPEEVAQIQVTERETEKGARGREASVMWVDTL